MVDYKGLKEELSKWLLKPENANIKAHYHNGEATNLIRETMSEVQQKQFDEMKDSFATYKFKKEDMGKVVLITTDKESLSRIGHAVEGEEILGNQGILIKEHYDGFCDVKVTMIEHYQNPPRAFEITQSFLNEQLTLK
jgi:hypothetical protein